MTCTPDFRSFSRYAKRVPPSTWRGREAELYRDAVAHAQTPTPLRPSIVHGQIAAATGGAFGDVRFTTRTAGSELFVNPLMSIYFTVRMEALARRNLYLDRLEGPTDMGQVSLRIEEFRAEISPRTARTFPH